jgi:hypothetical protein
MNRHAQMPKPSLTCANAISRHGPTRPGGSENRKVGGSTPPLATAANGPVILVIAGPSSLRRAQDAAM